MKDLFREDEQAIVADMNTNPWEYLYCLGFAEGYRGFKDIIGTEADLISLDSFDYSFSSNIVKLSDKPDNGDINWIVRDTSSIDQLLWIAFGKSDETEFMDELDGYYENFIPKSLIGRAVYAKLPEHQDSTPWRV